MYGDTPFEQDCLRKFILFLLPLAIWKIIDIGIWIYGNFSISFN